MSRLTQKDNSTFGNVNTHVFTEFGTFNKETTQKEVLQAIKDINISAEIGEITVESSDTETHSLLTTTNTKLDTLNTTVANKHLDYENDSVTIVGGDSLFNVSDADTHTTLTVISNTLINKHLDYQTDSVTVSVMPALNFTKDSVNVVEVVEPVLYNLQIVGTQMYADSINGAIVDIYGRDGWFWTNSASTTGGSNAYWYSNTIVPQNQMTKAQIECVYVILALDRVQPNIVLPIFPMYSLPTGSGDIAPFAHSSWTYVIPATNILNAGEVVMFTIGDHTKVDKIRPELRRVHLELLRTNGDALPTEVIGLISLNTDSGTKPLNSIQYLLQNAGFYYSVTNKIVEYEFNNGVQNAINVNLTEGGININGTVTVNGNVNVDNFPTSFQVSSLPSVEINNFPTSTEISNFPTSTEISNFPTSTEISNFPTSFEISNQVSVYDSNTEAINNKLINAAAPNNDCIKVFQANNPTSIEVSNFPTSFEISNFPTSTEISNFPTSTEISNFPTSFEVSSLPSVEINNFPTSTEISNFPTSTEISNFPTSFEVSNFPTSFEVSNLVNVYDSNSEAINQKLNLAAAPNNDCIKVFQANNPTSIEVTGTVTVNTISGYALETGGNLASIKSNTDRIKSDTTNADAIQVQVKNSSIPVSGNVTVNTISGFAVESGGNLASIKTNTDKIKSDTTNADAIQVQVKNSSIPVSGNVTVNTISGFAVESGGNLASIKTNTDKIKSDTTNADAIQVQVKNSSIPVSGNVTVNTISGFALDTTTQSTNTKLDTIHTDLDGLTYDGSSNLNVNVAAGSLTVDSVKIKATNGDSITATTGSINSNITNTSLDTRCYASSNGTNWHHLASDANGQLNVHSKLQDGAGTDITSTLNGAKQSIDVNVANTVAVNTISGFALETGGNLASIKTNTDKIKSDTTNTDAIQVQVKNSSIPVTGTITANIAANQRVLSNVYDWQNNGITSTNHTVSKYGLDTTSALATTDMNTRYLLTSTLNGAKQSLDVNVANTVAVTDSAGNNLTSTSNNLDTNMKAFNRTGATTSNLTTVQPVGASSSVKALETYSYMVGLNNTSTLPLQITSTTGDTTQSLDVQIQNGSTTNFNSGTGLNVYQILPKVKMYTIGGFDEQNSTYRLFGLATPGGINTTTTNFGLANPRVHYGGTSGGTDRVAYIDYVNSSGNLVENDGPYTFNSATYATLPNMIAPIKFRLTSNLAAGQAVYISIAANSSVSAVAGQDQNQYCIGTFTVPNGYIGYISHLNSNVSATTNIQIVKWDVNGIRSVVYRFNNTGNADHTAGYEGSLGGIFYAGETVAFSNQSTAAGKSCFANMILKSIL